MKLPMPVVLDGKVYDEAKLKEPTAADVANADREAGRGDPYLSLVEFAAGCVEELSGPDGSTADLRRALKQAPWETVVAISLYGKAEMDGDDGIASTVRCPSCGDVRRLELRKDDGADEDLRDHLYAMPVKYADGGTFDFDLSKPVKLTKRSRSGEEEIVIARVTLRYPTAADCSRAVRAVAGDSSRVGLAILAECLVALDGVEVSTAERASFGRLVFERMTVRDVGALNELASGYGIDPRVTRRCMKCGHEWEARVDVVGFFASGESRR